MGTNGLQNKIEDLEKSKNIQILGIETFDGLVSGAVIESAIDSLKETLENINLDQVAESVNNNLKEFAQQRI